eukprot:TRINITY_DN2285_c0_g1_i2.p1 TRINITY_DN2285_c0_g1~~TRINITY_DN2285_c0_g1_i2.p1  ORF type:complete len:606 (+),score=145.63 TRINITY_DN2285_c0_g1_i2:116-1933(+)
MARIQLLLAFVQTFLLAQVFADCGGRDSGKEIVEVLMWSGGSWAGFSDGDHVRTPNYLGHEIHKNEWYDGKGCPIDCRYTADKSRIGNVDGVIFEAQPITSYGDTYKWEPPEWPQKFTGQSWINHGYETQFYFDLYGDQGYLDHIDINFTYYLDSQVPLTFTCMWGGGMNISDLLKPHPPKTKDKCVVFMCTNCNSGGAGARTAYAKELMEHVSVDSYGQCLHNKDFPPEMQFPIYSDHGASMRNKIFIFTHYKFVLVFENNNVTDYVTEKMMNVIQAGAVPVYMGSPNVHPYWTPGENSIIKVSDYKGPEDLAKFLQKACDDDSEYEKFFEWKKKGLSSHFQQRLKDCAFYGAECRLCEYLLKKRQSLPAAQLAKYEERRRHLHTYKVAEFDGKSYFTTEFNEKLQILNDLSMSVWVWSKKTDATIIDIGGVVTLKIVKKGIDMMHAQLCLKDNCFYSGITLNDFGWQHIAVTFKFEEDIGGEVKWFINGVEDKSAESPTKGLAPSDCAGVKEVVIGANFKYSDVLSGILDDLSVWTTAVTPAQGKKMIWDVYAGHEEGIAAFWSFNTDGDPEDDISHKKLTTHGEIKITELSTKPMRTTNPNL